MPISTGKPTCQERSARTVGWRGFGKVLVTQQDALASAHARRSKNYAYQNWKAHLSGALRPDCGLARLWDRSRGTMPRLK